MSENEMPERIWIEGPCVVTNDPSDQKYYVHEDKYDYLTDDYLTEYRRAPSLPDVMEDGYVVMEDRRRVEGEFSYTDVTQIRVKIGAQGLFYSVWTHIEDCKHELKPHEEYVEFGVARMLGLPTLNETHHVQNNQIVKVEG